MRRRHPVALVALLLALAAGSACSGGSSPGDGPVPPPATTREAAPPGSGPLGLKWSWFQPETFDFVSEAGGGWTFAEVEWCDVEPSPGQREWTELDEVVRRAVELGHEPMLKLRTGQCWGTLPPVSGEVDTHEGAWKTPSTPPVDLATYLAFVTEVVQRYAPLGVHEWAVENEVDVANHWASDLPSYDALVRQVAPAIRAADPEARVLDAGLSSTTYGVAVAASLLRAGDEAGALAAYRASYGRRLAGGASRWPPVSSGVELATVLAGTAARRSLEALDLVVGLVTEGVVDAYQLHFYEPTDALTGVLDLLRERLGDTAPIEAWELGVAWPGDDWTEPAQAAELLRLVAVLLAHDVHRIVYLPVAYTPGQRVQVFRGLVHEDGELLAAGRLWVALTDALTGLADAPPTVLDGDLAGVAWTAADRDAAIVWAPGDPVTLPAGVTVLDAGAVPVDGGVDGGAPVGGDPVLVLGSPGEELVDRLADPGPGPGD